MPISLKVLISIIIAISIPALQMYIGYLITPHSTYLLMIPAMIVWYIFFKYMLFNDKWWKS